MNFEDYEIVWSIDGGKYVASLEEIPQVRGTGTSHNAAMEDLYDSYLDYIEWKGVIYEEET